MKAPWSFYLNSEDAWQAMLDVMKQARVSIKLEQFILELDDVGDSFIKLAQEKAAEGVQVKILLDAAGSFNFFGSSFWRSIAKPNFEIAFFNSVIPGTFGRHTSWYFRDHRKLLVVDSEVAFTGAVGLGERLRGWRDTHVKIEGCVVSEMELTFDRMWNRAHKRTPKSEKNLPRCGDGFNYIGNSPLPRRRYLYHRFIDALRGAREKIYLTTPYFVPDRRLLRVLKLAAHRGVDVRLLVPDVSDHLFVDMAGRSFFSKLLEAKIRVYEYKGRMIHAKTAVVDNDWSTMGSLNFDNISLRYNFEANLVSTDRQFTKELESQFVVDLHNAKEILLPDWQKRSPILKILERVGRLFSPLL